MMHLRTEEMFELYKISPNKDLVKNRPSVVLIKVSTN
jgi:hypothetical protein